jgi:ribonuclease HII
MNKKEEGGSEWIVGIDEVGRGPLAGPVTVCALAVPTDFNFIICNGIKDSKKLSPAKRQKWLSVIDGLKNEGKLNYSVISVSNEIIDTRGISFAIKSALEQSIRALSLDPQKTSVLLDGGLLAPVEFIFQKTIIKGDEKEPVISMASIVAKETRDAMMSDYAKEYSEYGFEKHKGYGTKAHMDAIKKHGMTIIHRHSFIHV